MLAILTESALRSLIQGSVVWVGSAGSIKRKLAAG